MVILLIAILLIGPKRMAQIVQSIGKLSRQMRRLSGEFVGTIRSEIQTTEEGIKNVVDEAKGAADSTEGITEELTETKKETDQSLKDIVEGDLGLSSITEDIRAVQREAQGMMQDLFSEVMTAADVDSKAGSRENATSGQVQSEQAAPQPATDDTPSSPDTRAAPVKDASDQSAAQVTPETIETTNTAPASQPPTLGNASAVDTDVVAAIPETEIVSDDIAVDGAPEPAESGDDDVVTAVPENPVTADQSLQEEQPKDEKTDAPTDALNDGSEGEVQEQAGVLAAETDTSEHAEPGSNVEEPANGETETTGLATETRPEVSKS
jgi:Sec-independent protein translocase protein TatA